MPPHTPSLFSTILALLLPPCLRSNDDHTAPNSGFGGKQRRISCNQYEGRIYLRPIMPITTRRRSRLLEEEGRGRLDSAGVDEGLRQDMDKGNKEVKMSVGKQGREGDVLEQNGTNVEVGDRRVTRQRTFSMEMNEAIEALHREEEDGDGDGDNVEALNSDVSTPSSTSSGPVLEIDEGTDESLPSTPVDTNKQAKESKPQSAQRIPILPTQGNLSTPAPRIVASTPPSQTSRPGMYYQPPAERQWTHVAEADRWTMEYLCHDCEASVVVKQGEPMRCKDCGCCMLWKKAGKKMRHFDAR